MDEIKSVQRVLLMKSLILGLLSQVNTNTHNNNNNNEYDLSYIIYTHIYMYELYMKSKNLTNFN